MALGILCRPVGADLLLATDRTATGWAWPSGTQAAGMRCSPATKRACCSLDYLCAQRTKHGRMPADPVMIKTIVTTDMTERIARRTRRDHQSMCSPASSSSASRLAAWKRRGRRDSFVFGFEESYGLSPAMSATRTA